MDIDGRTAVYALIGKPVGHSGSPAMYNMCFKKLGLNSVYVAFEVDESGTAAAIEGARALGIRGMNVTMPCKKAAAAAMDALSPAAAMTGAVNTIVNDGGRMTGYITDGEGFVNNLRDHGAEVCGNRLVLIGAGGAASAIEAQCAIEGAREISVFAQRAEYAESCRVMAERIMSGAPGCNINVYELADKDRLSYETEKSGIFINGTSIGMGAKREESPADGAVIFREGLFVADVVYEPRETRLVKEARAAGCRAVGGIGMLLWQGAAAFHLFTGRKMPTDDVRELFAG